MTRQSCCGLPSDALAGSDVLIDGGGVGEGDGDCQNNHAAVANSIVKANCDTVFVVVEDSTAKPYTVLQ